MIFSSPEHCFVVELATRAKRHLCLASQYSLNHGFLELLRGLNDLKYISKPGITLDCSSMDKAPSAACSLFLTGISWAPQPSLATQTNVFVLFWRLAACKIPFASSTRKNKITTLAEDFRPRFSTMVVKVLGVDVWGIFSDIAMHMFLARASFWKASIPGLAVISRGGYRAHVSPVICD